MSTGLLKIDGAEGEGGGQVLRTALGLSMVTGRAFHIENIRGRRRKPGLMRQHLACVRAAAEISAAEVAGDELASSELHFRPGVINGGRYIFKIGGAGSTSLVLQAVLPALLQAEKTTTLRITGGTHNPLAPSFDFLDRVFFPRLRAMGVGIEAELRGYGFFPAGGGTIQVKVIPAAELRPFEILRRGSIRSRKGRILCSQLPPTVGQREAETLVQKLSWSHRDVEVVEIDDSPGPGNVITLEVSDENGVCEMVTDYGAKGIRAERVAREAARELKRYLEGEAPVGKHLADQLLIPMALAGAGAFRTSPPTPHTTTNAALIERFLPVRFRFDEEPGGATTVSVAPR
jgi:RNA 3'-terminal phosphate cyclase (ATP)